MNRIKKIVKLGRVGRFIEYTAAGDVELRRMNLIYGENAKGKSTLTAVLRAVGTGDATALRGRKTLGDDRDLELKILCDAGLIQYGDGNWSGSSHPAVAVFDQSFISDNIYSGDSVGTNQRRNLYRVIVGERAVSLAKELDDLTTSNRQLANELRDARKDFAHFLPAGMSEEDYFSYEPAADLPTQISALERQLSDVSNAKEVVSTPSLQYLDNFELEEWFAQLLRKTLPDVATDAENRLQSHLTKHRMRADGGEEWLAQGVEFFLDDGCPFCGQDIGGSELVLAYQTLFSEAYRELSAEVAAATKAISARVGDRKLDETVDSYRQNKGLEEFWRVRVEAIEVANLDIDRIRDVSASVSKKAHRAIQQKLSAPLEMVDFMASASEDVAQLHEVNAAIDRYNAAVHRTNNLIDKFKESIAPANALAIRNRLLGLQQLARRSDPKIIELCDRIRSLESMRHDQDRRRKDLRAELDSVGGQFASTYEDRINELLANFGASFSLGRVSQNYVGGTNASFDIVIRRRSVAVGTPDTPLDQASFRNTLSNGDKSTLALAFFFAQLEHDPARKARVVVLDDPFNSQDRFRRNQSALEIAHLAHDVAQVILLSHDAGFLSDVDRKLVDLKAKVFRIVAVADDQSALVECELSGLLQQPIHAWIDALQRFVREGAHSHSKPEDIVQKIRPLLEAHCRNCCPGRFEDADTLSSMIGKIRAEGDGHRLYPALRELSDVHDYSKRYHHDDGSISGAVDEGELTAYVRRTLRFVTGL